MTTIYLIGGPYDLTKREIPNCDPPRQYLVTMHPRTSAAMVAAEPIPPDTKHAVYIRGHGTPTRDAWIYYYEGLEHEVWYRPR